ncbi:MAG: M24 family metallopeptidase [Anaerovoracaceae bacterium]|jgi:Xaa-Pro aminopeptidase
MQNRLKKIKEAMAAKGIEALLVTKSENQIYLTGFHSSNCQLVITADTNYLLTDFRYIEAAGELAPLYHVVLTDHDVTLYTFLKELDIKELAIEDSSLTYAEFKQLEEKVGCAFVSGDGIIEGVRVIKDDSELKSIKKAQQIADMAFIHMLNYLRPGLTETEAAFELEMFLRSHGAQALSFDTILVSGVRTSLPHGVPSEKRLENGDFVTMDFGCIVDGYCSDMTRTVALGSVTTEQKEIYNIVLEAQKAGCNAIRSGLSCKEADRVCRDIIADRGYGAYFGHGTGHGVGLEIHEAPTLNARSEEVLKENMVVTVEPGIYLPKKFGVRIEDLAIVTASGIINLVKSDKELVII